MLQFVFTLHNRFCFLKILQISKAISWNTHQTIPGMFVLILMHFFHGDSKYRNEIQQFDTCLKKSDIFDLSSAYACRVESVKDSSSSN